MSVVRTYKVRRVCVHWPTGIGKGKIRGIQIADNRGKLIDTQYIFDPNNLNRIFYKNKLLSPIFSFYSGQVENFHLLVIDEITNESK